ncbi:MAG: hypothetical protein IIB77_01140 [Proteobacteria bacterium]|nr:hypothetical protein [Pseudomonadota bacterium]
MTRTNRLIMVSIAFAGILSTQPAISQITQSLSEAPAIGGYSPVSYFSKNIAERGSPEFAVEHDGSVYYLTSVDQITEFKKNPDKYRPRHKSCPYSLAFGKVLPLDPTNFKIIGDSLLLFHISDDDNKLLLWNASEISEDELMRRADANMFRLDF